jgi:hypothetical protein
MSVDIFKEQIGSREENHLIVDGGEVMQVDLYQNPEDPQKPYFAANWPTTIESQSGIEAIKESHRSFKREFVATRRIGKVRRIRFFDKRVGAVNVALNGLDHFVALDFKQFIFSGSFQPQEGEPHPLNWIRVDTEYIGYWFDGEFHLTDDDEYVRKDHRMAGMIGYYNIAPQITEFYKATGRPVGFTQFEELDLTLAGLLEHLPMLEKRSP